MKNILIKNATIVNEGNVFKSDLLIEDKFIAQIAPEISANSDYEIVEADGLHLFPGIIDDQVHFREPGLTHKADIGSESRAGVAGGVTTFMEMPNTVPNAVTNDLLEEKYKIAKATSWANYSFYLGATNDNLEQVKAVDIANVCGIKIFMGSSTGNMLVDDEKALNDIYKYSPCIIAIHSESEEIIKRNFATYKEKYGDDIPPTAHHEIRSVDACLQSTLKAIKIAKEHNTKLHVLHISTAEEAELFENIPLSQKRITAEACVHHLFFDSNDYVKLGNLIKCNPAIKEARHKSVILNAVLNGNIDVIATDHAPHTWEEKQNIYANAPSGLPLISQSFNLMLDFYHNGKISLEMMADKMSHKVAELFQINKRGYLREGYYADLFLADINKDITISKDNIYYKCNWSPLEGYNFKGRVEKTYINGSLIFDQGKFKEQGKGMRLQFDRI